MARLTRRQLLGIAGGVAAGGAAVGAAWRGVGAGLERRKNVLLIVVDSLRADHLGCYGNQVVQTPGIDALAREGVRFTRVYPSAMPTVPARRSIMTGRQIFPFQGWQPWDGLGRTPGWAPILPSEPTLVTELRRLGYWTGCVTDNPFLSFAPPFAPFRRSFHRFYVQPGQGAISVPPGDLRRVSADQARATLPIAFQDPRHIDAMRRYMVTNGVVGGSIDESQIAAARVFSTAQDLLRDGLGNRPFLLVVDSFDPHEPWVVPDRDLDLYREPGDDTPALGDTEYGERDMVSGRDLARMRTTYAASVTMVDRHVGQLLETLRGLRLDESTVVMLVSDHGFALGEHDWIGKSAWHLHPELIHVPLIVRHPDGRGAGRTCDWFASTHDLAPTLVSLSAAARSQAFDGADLTPMLAGQAAEQARPLAFGGYSNHFFARDDRWALISHNHGIGQKLFDLTADPTELRDVSPARGDVVQMLYERVVAAVGETPPVYARDEMDASPRHLRSR